MSQSLNSPFSYFHNEHHISYQEIHHCMERRLLEELSKCSKQVLNLVERVVIREIVANFNKMVGMYLKRI